MAGRMLLVAVLVAACTALFDNDDLSAFLYPDELNSILSKQDEDLWCWYVRSTQEAHDDTHLQSPLRRCCVGLFRSHMIYTCLPRVQPIFNGNGKDDLTSVMFTYDEAREILAAYAYQMSPPELYHARLRDKLNSTMIIAFDNMFFQWFNDLSARSEVTDSFLGILIPIDPIDLEQMLCIELFALLRRFDAFVPFDVDIETWLTRRYDFTVLEKHFEVPLIFPDAYVSYQQAYIHTCITHC